MESIRFHVLVHGSVADPDHSDSDPDLTIHFMSLGSESYCRKFKSLAISYRFVTDVSAGAVFQYRLSFRSYLLGVPRRRRNSCAQQV
jgi:hypothetical protein